MANEGLNGQFAVATDSLHAFDASLRVATDGRLGNTALNIGNPVAAGQSTPFRRFRVVCRPQILTDGFGDDEAVLDWQDAGEEVPAQEWHARLSAPDADQRPLLLDCRNDYETEAGTFRGAVPLDTDIFSESWDRLENLLADTPRDKPLLTFCTGGIRCVKVGAFLKQRLGFEQVGHVMPCHVMSINLIRCGNEFRKFCSCSDFGSLNTSRWAASSMVSSDISAGTRAPYSSRTSRTSRSHRSHRSKVWLAPSYQRGLPLARLLSVWLLPLPPPLPPVLRPSKTTRTSMKSRDS